MTPTIIVGILFIVVIILAFWAIDIRLERIEATLQRIESGIDVDEDEEWQAWEMEEDEN